MEMNKLIERCNKVKEIAGNTIPFNAPAVAPDLTTELLAIKFEAIRTFVDQNEEFAAAFNDAKETMESLVRYYGNYFFRGQILKQ